MAVKVRIPAPLRKHTGGLAAVAGNGATAGDVLKNLTAAHDGLRPTLFDDAGALRNYVNVFVGEANIRDLQGLDTPVKDGDELSIVPAIAGG